MSELVLTTKQELDKPPVWARFRQGGSDGDVLWIGLKIKDMELYLDYNEDSDKLETDWFYEWESLLKNKYRYESTLTLPELPDGAVPVVRGA